MTRSVGSVEHDVLAGLLLAYGAAQDVGQVEDVVREHPASGFVVRGAKGCDTVARLRLAGLAQPLVFDLGAWSKQVATAAAPMGLPIDGLFPIELDRWACDVAGRGASVVLTPSRFVSLGSWAALRAVLRVGAAVAVPQVRTLVATDAAMLEPARRGKFLDTIGVHAGGRRLAFVFADKKEPLAHRERMTGLRSVLARFPGSLVLGAEVLAATDVVAHGGSAAVGLTGGLRRPLRPGDGGGGPQMSKGWMPGLFLRQIWETRSPGVYADWFANSASPTCGECGDRALDGFSPDPADKRAVLRHNVHAWMQVHAEIMRRRPDAARDWLHRDRCRGLDAHAEMRPIPATLKADALLRALCELDDPQQRRTTATGQWR